ncbi:putative nucleic-acid-binding protein [Anaerovibrio sp. JC8]|uniref:RNase P modulator RnpM n=1 Tax=Anaerovibrio sp. JC8 TaxID=1240085 RepID=UPI000A09EB9D|nr:YlxR family protein [Anaerovibrio sp. JC8]ORU00244.1 putative nucleic-acid-binding protein [Anaerovibrio sp. JC8]
MATVKKIPTRLCIGCQEQHPKKELVRIVRSPEGEFSIDLTGKKAGRGAYICNNKECFQKAVKEHRFDRSFKCTVDKNIFDELEKQLFE